MIPISIAFAFKQIIWITLERNQMISIWNLWVYSLLYQLILLFLVAIILHNKQSTTNLIESTTILVQQHKTV